MSQSIAIMIHARPTGSSDKAVQVSGQVWTAQVLPMFALCKEQVEAESNWQAVTDLVVETVFRGKLGHVTT